MISPQLTSPGICRVALTTQRIINQPMILKNDGDTCILLAELMALTDVKYISLYQEFLKVP